MDLSAENAANLNKVVKFEQKNALEKEKKIKILI